MLIASAAAFQVVITVEGLIFALCGALCAYVSFRCASGKLKPNYLAGIRLILSRNHGLYQQDKYWYELNRYGGKLMLPISVAWILLSIVAIVLPVDPGTRVNIILAVITTFTVVLFLFALYMYRYADRLVSQDKQYIQKT